MATLDLINFGGDDPSTGIVEGYFGLISSGSPTYPRSAATLMGGTIHTGSLDINGRDFNLQFTLSAAQTASFLAGEGYVAIYNAAGTAGIVFSNTDLLYGFGFTNPSLTKTPFNTEGPQGSQGPVGQTGSTGATGATGTKGDKGDTGGAGPKGDKGDTGDHGSVNKVFIDPNGNGNGTVSGSGGNDDLYGFSGNDRLIGGKGADNFWGGAGKDAFVFKALSDSTASAKGRDTIYDFAKGDLFDLKALDASAKAKGNQAFTFIGADKFHGKAGELRFEKLKSDTYVYADVNGDKKVDFAFHLDDAVKLTKADFLL